MSGGPPLSASARGRAGEAVAARLLEAAGWTIVARNYRAGRGEIDLVASRGEILAFVEVKAWSSLGLEALEAALDRKKRRRIVETSKIFLALHREYSSARVRYDVVLLRGDGTVAYAESAFTGDV